MKCRPSLSTAIVLGLLVTFQTKAAAPQFPPATVVVVPSRAAKRDANDRTLIPFMDMPPPGMPVYVGSFRYQQVHAASDFAGLPTRGAFLTYFLLRADCQNRGGATSTNLSIQFSTTSRGPDSLSSSFLENLGLDVTAFRLGLKYGLSGAGTGSCTVEGDPGFSALQMIVGATPFFYLPSRGNLLLDITSDGLANNPVSPEFEVVWADAESTPGDAVSRVYSRSSSSLEATVNDTSGLPLMFVFHPIPVLSVTWQTNVLVLQWSSDPRPFRLQCATRIEQQADWAAFAGEVEIGGLYSTAPIPPTELREKRFFRLFWNSPQPGLPLSVSAGDAGPARVEDP